LQRPHMNDHRTRGQYPQQREHHEDEQSPSLTKAWEQIVCHLLKKRQFVQRFVPIGSIEHTEYAEHESDRENDEGGNLMNKTKR